MRNNVNYAGDLSGVDYSDSTPDVAYGYNRLGRQTQITVGTSSTASLTYNDVGELLTESYSGGPLSGLIVTNGYDNLLRRTAVALSNQPSTLVQFGYDNASRLATVSAGANRAAYSYLANSPLVENVYFTNGGVQRMVTSKSYDNLNRLTQIASAPSASSAVTFSYAYNSANQRTAVTNADNSRWAYGYDTLGQVTSGRKYWSDGTNVAGQQFEYNFDDIGNRQTAASGGDQYGSNLRTAYYTNNSLNQITSRTVPGYVNVLGEATNTATVTLWSSSGAYATTSRKGDYFRGELAETNTSGVLWLTITNLAVLSEGTNQAVVTNVVGDVFLAQTPETFGYDADGNLTNDGRWSLTWDAENRLVNMTSLSSGPAGSKLKLDFSYDYQSRRIEKIVSTNNGSAYYPQSTNRFVYDGWNLIAILDPQSSILQSFMWGLDLSGTMQGAGGVGGLLAVNDSANGTHFCAYDGNGNVTALVKATDGTVSANYEYGPFGELLRATGLRIKANPFRFSTKYQDDESDLLYYGYRSYNPALGRWPNRDPLGEAGGINLYGFVYNNPPNLVDKDGRIVPILIVAAIAGVYFSTEQYANAPGPGDPTYGGFTGDNILAFADLGVVLSAKLVQGLSKCLCKPVCSRLVPGGGLGAHEAAGGHALGRHVPQGTATAAQVQAALAARLAADASIPAASAFASRAVAEKAVVEALEANQGAICAWLSGSANRLVVTHTAGSPVGVVLARGAASPTAAREVVVVLDKVAPQSGLCFRVTTAYPK